MSNHDWESLKSVQSCWTDHYAKLILDKLDQILLNGLEIFYSNNDI